MIRISVVLLLSLGLCAAQDRHDWKSVSSLTSSDAVRLTLKTGKSVSGVFQAWTPDSATVGTATIKREDVKKVERIRKGGRGKHTAIGAAIGFGGGFAIGAAAGGCHPSDFICLGRGRAGAAVGGAGMVIGALVGVLLPAHHKDLIYTVS